jgi:hypothetical protein
MKSRPHVREARWLVVVASALIASGVLVTASAAARASAPQAQTEENFTTQDVAANRLTGQELQSDQVTQDYLADQVARGRNLDIRRIRASDVGDAKVVWDSGVDIDRIGVVDSGSTGGVGVIQHENGTGSAAPSLPPGMGMNAFYTVKGASFMSSDCITVTVNGNRATSCYEKYRITETSSGVHSSTENWYSYNRWGTGHPSSVNNINEVTIRSRPWSGYKSRINGMPRYWPTSGGDICPGSSSSVTVGYGGFSATLPIDTCTQTDIDPDTSNFSMMSQWKYTGALCPSAPKSARSAQFNIVLRTKEGLAPIMADYIWTAYYVHGLCPFKDVAAWHDSGW